MRSIAWGQRFVLGHAQLIGGDPGWTPRASGLGIQTKCHFRVFRAPAVFRGKQLWANPACEGEARDGCLKISVSGSAHLLPFRIRAIPIVWGPARSAEGGRANGRTARAIRGDGVIRHPDTVAIQNAATATLRGTRVHSPSGRDAIASGSMIPPQSADRSPGSSIEVTTPETNRAVVSVARTGSGAGNRKLQ